jgi:choline-glycine betaine transporter
MKKALTITICLLLIKMPLCACIVCGKQQPKIIKSISHGTGPQSNWDYVIVISVALIVLISLIYSIKWLVKPGEKETTHIKHSSFILE